jgi:hypothetical protein
MALDQTRANEVLTWMHGGAQPAALTTPIRLRLLATIGNATTNGTEIAAGGSYVQTTAGGSTGGVSTGGNWAAASGGSQQTNAVISQTNMPAVTTAAVDIVDSTAVTFKRVEFGALTASKTTALGDTLSFASGAITSALA